MNAEQLEILSDQVALLKRDQQTSAALLNELDNLLHKIHDEVPGCYERAVQLVFDWHPNMKAFNTEGPSTGVNSVSFNGKPIAAPGSPFGNPATGLFGEGAKLPTNYGTTNHPFQPRVERDLVADESQYYQTISSQKCYRRFSLDELRLQDYANRIPQNLFSSTAPKQNNTPDREIAP
ncbi:hypothetical protein SLS56_008210 [Neofusicoccum ribis]|uniref:Uncharacterized protein n=1 Tax=Neofusicoccum ribis TaxID=45134 RepID=A0ABR3SKV0_9PEZI